MTLENSRDQEAVPGIQRPGSFGEQKLPIASCVIALTAGHLGLVDGASRPSALKATNPATISA